MAKIASIWKNTKIIYPNFKIIKKEVKMKTLGKSFLSLICLIVGPFSHSLFAAESGKTAPTTTNPTVTIKTNMGDIEAVLYSDKAPTTVLNFLSYVRSGHYTKTIFHRVINDFMIQGGGFDEGFNQKKTQAPIKNEASKELKNEVGTLAMARTNEPNSATAQFFINVKDNDFLNFRDPSPAGIGYAVFGKVTSGMDVVNKIKLVKTKNNGPHQNVPAEPVIILEITEKK